MGRPRQHDETTAESLLDAAERQLRSGGLDGVSMRSIADDADVSIRAIYSLFGSRDGLVDALAIRTFARLRERIAAIAPTDNPIQDLVTAGREFFALAVESPESYRLAWERVFTTDLETKPAWADEALHARNALGDRIDRVLGSDVPKSERRRLTAAFHAICQGFASCQVNRVFDGMRVSQAEALLATTLRHWVEAEQQAVAG